MKALLAVLLAAVSLNAAADSWSMPNKGNGEIVLTDVQCKGYKELFQAYTYTNSGYWDGCWTIIDGDVHIGWKNPNGTVDRRVYKITDFEVKTTSKKKGTAL